MNNNCMQLDIYILTHNNNFEAIYMSQKTKASEIALNITS